MLGGFWLDVRMFLIVEVVRAASLGAADRADPHRRRAPVLFPLRMLAIVFVDVMRGVPTILLVYPVRLRGPGTRSEGVPTSATVLGGVALALCYSAYVSEVFRAGIQSIHPSQGGAALALGLTPAQALRT